MMVTAVTGFISLPLFLRFLGNENYAVWIYALAFAGFFGFAELGLGVAVGRYVSVALGQNDRAAMRAYWGTGNAIILPILLIAATSLGFFGCWLGPKWYNVGAHLRLFQLCVVATSFEMFFNYYTQYWMILSQAHLDFKFVGSLRAIMSLVRMGPAVALAYSTHQAWCAAFWFSFASLLELIFFAQHGYKIYRLGLEFSAASMVRLREMAGFLSKNLVMLISGSIFGQIDRNVLGRYATNADFSYYAVAANLANRLQGVSISVMGPVFYNTSRIASHERQRSAAAVYNETFQFVLGWYALAAAWVITWHPVFTHVWLVHTMGTEKGLAAAVLVGPLLVPLVLAACIGAQINIANAQLSSLNRMEISIIYGAAAGFSALFAVWAGWRWAGVEGAAWGFLASRIFLVVQDIHTARLIQAGGWLSWATARMIFGQASLAAVWSLVYFVFPATSPWMLIPAALHGGMAACWLLRGPLGRWIASRRGIR